MFSNHFNVLISKIIFKKYKKNINMHFSTNNIINLIRIDAHAAVIIKFGVLLVLFCS